MWFTIEILFFNPKHGFYFNKIFFFPCISLKKNFLFILSGIAILINYDPKLNNSVIIEDK